MAWLRVDDGFDSHPKILALGSDQRRWTWTRILVYTCRYRSALVPENITETVPRATRQFLSECVELGLIDITDDGAMVVHDWDGYNGSDPKVQVRERVRKHREKRYNSVTDTVTDALPEPLQERYSRVGARARPVPNPSQTTSPAAPTSLEDPDPRAAALIEAGWTEQQLSEAWPALDRALALLREAQADPICRAPGALAWTKFKSGLSAAEPVKPKTCPECGLVIRPPTTLADHLWQTHDIELEGAAA